MDPLEQNKTKYYMAKHKPAEQDATPELEGVEYDDSPEEKKDFSIRLALIFVAALTIIGAFVFYVNKYTRPQDNRVSLFDAVFTNPDTNGGASNTNASDVLISQYEDRLRQQEEGLGASSTTASSTRSGSLLDKDTFGVTGTSTKQASTSKNIITEYIVRATSTSAFSTTTRMDVLSKSFVSKELGISFLVDPFWSITTKANTPASIKSGAGSSVVYIKKVGPKTIDTITIQRFKGVSVTTEDSQFGNVTYYYDSETQKWIRIDYTDSISTSTVIYPEFFTPLQLTINKKPIFEGTSVTKTLIVALDTNDFIIVNIKGSENSRILDSFVRNIK